MLTIKNIDHIVLATSQADKMVDFYCGVLNCDVVNRQPDIGLTQLKAGSSIIDIETSKVAPQKDKLFRNMFHFCLFVENTDFESLKSYFQEQQIEPLRYSDHRFGATGYGPSFYITDPEGNEIEIKGANM